MERFSLPSWLLDLVLDPETSDICVQGDLRVDLIRRSGHRETLKSKFKTPEEATQTAILFAQEWGVSYRSANPFLSFSFQKETRVHLVFPPAARNGAYFSFRNHLRGGLGASQRRWEAKYFDPLAREYEIGKNILIAGPTGSGKTTLAADLINQLRRRERILVLEDAQELCGLCPGVIPLLARQANADGFGEISLRTLVKESLRMRPDRIILGECRGEEVLDFMNILSAGHRGALATIHANTSREAIVRLRVLSTLYAERLIHEQHWQELLKWSLQKIVVLRRKADAGMEIAEVSEVSDLL